MPNPRDDLPFDEEEVITLTDEDGSDQDFIFLDAIQVGTSRYAVLVPTGPVQASPDLTGAADNGDDEDASEPEAADLLPNLAPAEISDDDDEALILRMDTDENGEMALVAIDDEDEWQRVVDAWDQLSDLEEDEDEDADE
ncbi:MAG: DUF1292 domain-containing protein [Sulfobacillus sp.]